MKIENHSSFLRPHKAIFWWSSFHWFINYFY